MRATTSQLQLGELDALGSHRVYKKAWDDNKLLTLFRSEREEHFDSILIDAFLGNLDELYEIAC